MRNLITLILLVVSGGCGQQQGKDAPEPETNRPKIVVAHYDHDLNRTLVRPSAIEKEAANLAIDHWKITKLDKSFYLCEIDTSLRYVGDREEPDEANTAKTIFEFRDLAVDVVPDTLSEADKLNGEEWRGNVSLSTSAVRSYNPQESKLLSHQPDKTWTAWREGFPGGDWHGEDRSQHYAEKMSVRKSGGKWETKPSVHVLPYYTTSHHTTSFKQVEPADLPK